MAKVTDSMQTDYPMNFWKNFSRTCVFELPLVYLQMSGEDKTLGEEGREGFCDSPGRTLWKINVKLLETVWNYATNSYYIKATNPIIQQGQLLRTIVSQIILLMLYSLVVTRSYSTLIWWKEGEGLILPTPSPCWFPLNNLVMVKAVILAICSIL